MSKTYCFVVNDEELLFNFGIDTLSKFPTAIRDELFSNDRYFVHSNVTKEIFHSSFDYFLDNSKLPTINSDNIYFYYILNDEFGFLSDLLRNPEFDMILKISILKNTNKQNNPDIYIIENFISQNLEFYLQTYPNDLYNVPYNSLYNIFNNTNRNLQNHDIAYQFITYSLPAQKPPQKTDSNLFVLIKSLDSDRLSSENLLDSFSKREDHFGFIPKFNFNQFIDLVETSKELKAQNDELIQEIQKLQKENEKNKEKKSDFDLSKDEIQLIAVERSNNIKKMILTGKTICATFPNFLTSIPIKFYFGCEKLKKVKIPNSVIKIEREAFSNCSMLMDISIPDSVTHIGCRAFSNCINLSKIDIPPSVISIGEEAFSKCQSLKSVIIPYQLKTISKKTFFCCLSLSKVTFNKCLELIDEGAFQCCEMLTEVYIEADNITFQSNIFKNCFSMKKIEINANILTMRKLSLYAHDIIINANTFVDQ